MSACSTTITRCVKRPDRYTILLTGGSVAAQLAQLDPWPAPRYLEEELNNEYESPNGQPFWVLNGGDGAWKQPQPFILFALNAQALDAVVTLGGLNDYYLFRPWERERLEYPVNNFLAVNPLVADDNFGDAAIGWVLGGVAGGVASDPVLGQSHAAYLLFRALEAVAKGRTAWTSTKRTTLESLFALPADIAGEGERVFTIQLELLEKYNRAMEALARDYDIKTAYFFQPVPAYGKTLTAEEQAVVGDLSYLGLYRRMVDGVCANAILAWPYSISVICLSTSRKPSMPTAPTFSARRSGKVWVIGSWPSGLPPIASAWGLKRKQPATRGLESSR